MCFTNGQCIGSKPIVSNGPTCAPKNGWWNLAHVWGPIVSQIYVVWQHCLETHKSKQTLRFWRECELIGMPWRNECSSAVYSIYTPFCNGSYIGETGCGVFERFKTHLSNARNAKGSKCKFMNQVKMNGWWNLIPVPLIGLRDEIDVATRKFLELRLIRWQQPKWNTVGMSNSVKVWGEKVVVIDSERKQKRTRDLMKYRKPQELGSFAVGQGSLLNPVHERGSDALSCVVRLCRRPIRNIPVPLKREFKSFRNRKLNSIVKIAQTWLDEREFGIFQSNWMRIFSYEWDFGADIVCNHRLKLVGGFNSRVWNGVRDAFQPLVDNVSKRLGLRVRFNITIFSKTPQTTYDILRNEHMWGRMDELPSECS